MLTLQRLSHRPSRLNFCSTVSKCRGKRVAFLTPIIRLDRSRKHTLQVNVSMGFVETATITALLAFGLYKLLQFAVADADLNLYGKRLHHPKAFDGKVVWITGASQGIGAALSKYLAAHGAKLILSSRSQEKLEAVKADCKADAENVRILPFDALAKFSDLQITAKTANDLFPGGIDILIHNAGAGQAALAIETTETVVREMFELNTLAPINLTQAVLPYMLEKKRGQIASIISLAGRVPAPGQATYAGTKMGLYGYLSSLAGEIADQGISVTMCLPGPVSTGIDRPRVLYGSTGLRQVFTESVKFTKGKVTPQRCAQLVANAIAHRVDECWISKHPILLLAYLHAFLPSLSWTLVKKLGPKRARAVAAGKSGYDMKNLS